MKKIITIILLLLLILSCKTLTEQKKNLQGNWKCSAITGAVEYAGIATDSIFLSIEKNRYTYQSRNIIDKGRFAIENDDLFFIGDNRREKVMKIVKITPDTIILKANVTSMIFVRK